MSERRLRIAYLVAAAAVTLAVVGLSLLSGGPDAPPERRTRPSPTAPADRKQATSAPASVPGREPPDPAGGKAERLAARTVTARFLRAFLRYERGDAGVEVKRALAATTEAGLARQLLGQPVRSRAPVAPGEVTGLVLYGPSSGRVRASAVIARPRQGRALLELELRDGGRGWRVVSIAP